MLTHTQESELNMKREFDVMPEVEQVGKRWENTAFISCLAIQFSQAWYQDTAPNPNLR